MYELFCFSVPFYTHLALLMYVLHFSFLYKKPVHVCKSSTPEEGLKSRNIVWSFYFFLSNKKTTLENDSVKPLIKVYALNKTRITKDGRHSRSSQQYFLIIIIFGFAQFIFYKIRLLKITFSIPMTIN